MFFHVDQYVYTLGLVQYMKLENAIKLSTTYFYVRAKYTAHWTIDIIRVLHFKYLGYHLMLRIHDVSPSSNPAVPYIDVTRLHSAAVWCYQTQDTIRHPVGMAYVAYCVII